MRASWEASAAREPWEPGSQKDQGHAHGNAQEGETETTHTVEAVPSTTHTSFCTYFTVPFSAPIQPL